MGKTGSDVAKQAADILLMDDNFPSILKGIEESRLLFENLKKSICYSFSHLLPETFPSVASLMFGLPTALTSLQVKIFFEFRFFEFSFFESNIWPADSFDKFGGKIFFSKI